MRAKVMILSFCVGCIPTLETGQEVEPWSCPANNWTAEAPPKDLKGEGFFEGQILRDAELIDQNGDITCIWQFYGQILVVDVSTVWCGPCQEIAEGVQETADHYLEKEFTYVTVITEDLDRNEPVVQDLIDWVEYFEIQEPVLMDPLANYSGGSLDGGTYPAIMIVDREMRVSKRITSQPSDEKIREAIDEIVAAE